MTPGSSLRRQGSLNSNWIPAFAGMTIHRDFMLKLNEIFSKYYGYLISILFLLVGFYGILHHEMWRDELQSFLIAKNSGNLFELFKNIRYEGHPGLWYFFLFIITRFSGNPFYMQIAHLLIAGLSVFLVAKFSPFNKLEKLLFAFGYFPLYEYGIISRNYSLGMLFIIIFCLLFSSKKNILFLTVPLFFLAQTSVFGLIIAFFLFLYLLLELLIDNGGVSYKNVPEIMLAVLIASTGFYLAYLQLKVPADSGVYTAWNTILNIDQAKTTFSIIWRAYVPIPINQLNFWNTNFVTDAGRQYIYSIILFIIFGLTMIRKPTLMIFYIFSTLAVMLFFYTKFPGFLRHQGNLFLILFACLWIYKKYLVLNKEDLKLENIWFSLIVTLLFSANVYAAYIAYKTDYANTFSAGRETMQYIKNNNLENDQFVGAEDFTSASVIGYSNKEIYFPESGRWGTYVIWDKKRHFADQLDILQSADKITLLKNSKVLVILNSDNLDVYLKNENSDFSITKLKSFGPSIVDGETFSLYEVSKK